MRKLLFILIVLVSFLFTACQYYSYGLDEFFYRSNTVDKRASRLLELKDFVNEDGTGKLSGEYEVLIITDVHFGGENMGKNGRRMEDEFIQWIKNTYTSEDLPKFVICLGDVAEHGLAEEYEDYENFTKQLKEEFGLVTYNVIGNHDLYNAGWSHYEKHCYPYTSFYKFNTEKFSWYFLDSASCSLGNDQLMAFKKDMEYREPGRKKLVFTHVPVYAGGRFYFVMQNTTERNKLISYCAENKVQAFIDGHTHKEISSNIGFTEYNLPGFLEKRGFGIITVDENKGTAYCRTVYYN